MKSDRGRYAPIGRRISRVAALSGESTAQPPPRPRISSRLPSRGPTRAPAARRRVEGRSPTLVPARRAAPRRRPRAYPRVATSAHHTPQRPGGRRRPRRSGGHSSSRGDDVFGRRPQICTRSIRGDHAAISKNHAITARDARVMVSRSRRWRRARHPPVWTPASPVVAGTP